MHDTIELDPHPTPNRQARPITLAALEGAPKQVIRDRVSRVMIIFIVDDSGSMYGPYADSDGTRYAAALSVVNLMQRAGGGRAGVIHFGQEAPLELALPPVSVRRDKKAIGQSLVVPPTLGGTNLARALSRAAELTPPPGADESVLYYVITDGLDDVSPAVRTAIGALAPGSVHMLLVDRAKYCDAQLEAAWRTCAFGSFTRLDTFDTRQLATQIGQIFARSLRLELPNSPSPEKR